jgi:hypothetical protein
MHSVILISGLGVWISRYPAASPPLTLILKIPGRRELELAFNH